MMKPRIKVSLAYLLVTLLPACSSATSETIVPTRENTAPPSAEVTAAATSTGAGAWKTYRSAQAGYSVEHPADWNATEQAGSDGSIVTTFSSPDGSTSILIMVQNGEFGGAGSSDLPNTRCAEIEIGGVSGTRCFDTLSFSTSTTFVSQGKTYIISSTSKRLDAAIYDHFLSSFQLL